MLKKQMFDEKTFCDCCKQFFKETMLNQTLLTDKTDKNQYFKILNCLKVFF